MPQCHRTFEQEVEPKYRAAHGHTFSSFHDIRKSMVCNPQYQFWSSMQRCSQEMMWESVIAPVQRQQQSLIDNFKAAADARDAGGSLVLNPNLEVPRYHTANDIHLQPGGYHTENVADDVSAGAIYESSLPIYIDGELGPQGDGIGQALLGYFQYEFEAHKPTRILDMGCTVGNSTLPWATAFAGAEVHAIDVAAPCLRYAHARAESANIAVHFSQQNAEKTNFDSGSFDLVVSHIMFHETSKPALLNILKETYRLLREGGVMLHLDVPRGNTPYEKFMSQWGDLQQ